MFRKQISFTLLLIILCSLAMAVNYGYTLELGDYHNSITSIKRSQFVLHSNTYEFCSGEEKIIPIWIKNTQDEENTFTLKLNAPKFAKLTSNSFALPAKKSGVAFLVLSSKLGLEQETTLYLDTIPSAGVGSRTPIIVKINDCYDFELKLIQDNEFLCACESKDYSFSLENKGIDAEFDLEISGQEYASLGAGNVSKVTVKSNTISELNFNVNLPCEITTDSYKLVLKASLPKVQDLISEDTFNLKTHTKEECYSLNAPVKDISINPSTKEHTLRIKNTGLKNAEYSVSLEAPDWVILSKDKLNINSGKTENLNILFTGTEDVGPGDYGVTITLKNDNDEVTQSFNIKLNEENQFVKSVKDFLTFYKYYFIAAIVILLIIVGTILVLKRKPRKKKKVKEEPKNESKESKKIVMPKIPRKFMVIGEVIILAIIVIAVIIYLLNKFGISFVKIKNLFYIIFIPIRDFISLYFYYFIIGIVLLAILIFILNKFSKDN